MTNIHEVDKIQFPSMTAFEKKHLARKRSFWVWLKNEHPCVITLIAFTVALTLFDKFILPMVMMYLVPWIAANI